MDYMMDYSRYSVPVPVGCIILPPTKYCPAAALWPPSVSAHDPSATSWLSVVLAPLIPSGVGCLLWAWGNPRHELNATPRGGSWTVTFYRMKESSSQLIRVSRGSRGGPRVRVFEYRRAYLLGWNHIY